MPPNHISRWSPRSLESLADHFNWTLECWELEPPNLRDDIVLSFSSRFVRKSQIETSWENRAGRLASKMKSPGVSKAIKLCGAIASWSCWVAALGPIVHGPASHSLWAHLRRPVR